MADTDRPLSFSERLELGQRLRRQDQMAAGLERPGLIFVRALWTGVWTLLTGVAILLAMSGSHGFGWGAAAVVGLLGAGGATVLRSFDRVLRRWSGPGE